MEYEQELVEVKKELLDVETQIEELLERQNQLHQKKKELERILKENSKKESTSIQALNDKQWDSTDFAWSKDLHTKMKEVFGIDCLRPMQLQTMNVSLLSKDCMLIMPTGGGKSLCFQLPALLSKGITLVVSPLISLMEDQVMALENLQIEAALLNASSDKDYVKRIQDAMLDKKSDLHLLYVTPEKLAKSKRFMGKLEKMYQMGRFSRLVIDEVHCCSQWGHDFRPDYKFLGIMKRQFPGVPILGLTATATLKVLDDVKKILNIPHAILFKASFNRPNLYYEVKQKPATQKDAIDEIAGLIKSRFRGQSGIIYCFSQKETYEIAKELITRGIKAGCYHASMSASERSHVHKAWISNSIQVVVATVAFGMGIDKPDVRFVIHHSLSKSMENLYQESGRAGRDDKESHCIIYYRLQDLFRQSTMVFTEQTGLENLYGIISYCIDLSRCRRSVIARHFGEVWERAQCNEMCDHCDSKKQFSVQKRDITKSCQDIITILNEASRTDQRVTGNKLVDAWIGKGQASLKVKSIATPPFTVEACERILAFMIIQGYLKEDFHFTPYSTISYLVPGPKSRMLNVDSHQVMINFRQKKSSSISSSGGICKEKTSPSSVTASSSKTCAEAEKDKESGHSKATSSLKNSISNGIKSSNSKKKSITASSSNLEKNKLHLKKVSSNSVKPKQEVGANNKCNSIAVERTLEKKSENKDNKQKGKLSLGKRRRVLISDSEDDDIMDLDFCDKDEFEPKAVKIQRNNKIFSTDVSAKGETKLRDNCESDEIHNSNFDESDITVIDDSD